MGYTGRVLVIEDDSCFDAPRAERLRQHGLDVITAADGDEGIRIAKTPPLADVVVVDLLATPQRGLDVLRALLADSATAGIPVVLLSDSMPEETRRTGAAPPVRRFSSATSRLRRRSVGSCSRSTPTGSATSSTGLAKRFMEWRSCFSQTTMTRYRSSTRLPIAAPPLISKSSRTECAGRPRPAEPTGWPISCSRWNDSPAKDRLAPRRQSCRRSNASSARSASSCVHLPQRWTADEPRAHHRGQPAAGKPLSKLARRGWLRGGGLL